MQRHILHHAQHTLLLPLAEALGIATLCLMWVVNPLVDPAHGFLYHWTGTAAAIFIPVTLDLLLFWFAVTIVLLLASRYQPIAVYVWTGIAVLLPWAGIKDIVSIFALTPPRWIFHALLAATLLALLVLFTFARHPFQAVFPRLQHLLSTVLCAVGCIGLLTLGQLLWFGLQARGLTADTTFHTVLQPSTRTPPRPRVIWIVLDELSYQQIYADRLPGLQLPAFDRLAAQSTLFTHVIPAGNSTEKVLPSLITGQPVNRIRSSSSGELSIHTASAGWQSFDPHRTVFQDAINAGYNTAIAGWYNPYCRILAPVLDSCFRGFTLPFVNHLDANASILQNMLAPFHKTDFRNGQRHIDDYLQLSAHADAMLHDSSLNFLLLHMPIPHPGGIYNRASRQLDANRTSYIDNLALADLYLAHVRNVLEQAGQWDDATIVVMGDHSWRTRMWRNTTGWTPEEQRASHGGQFDDRPAFILKLPRQTTPAIIATPFPALRTRALLDQLLNHNLTSPQTLSTWATNPPATN
jgi:hypothetical protein